MLRSRILTGLVVAVFAGVFASQVASCTLDQEGTTAVETGKACATDANCDDGNPCTTDKCPTDTLVCEYAKQGSGPAPDSAQTAEDCKRVVCTAGTPSSEDDAADFINDNNSCTVDACTNGMPTNQTMMDGSACSMGTKTGTCNAGTCEISCANNNDCDDSNPCSDDLCNTSTSKCVYTNIDGLPTPGVAPILGDCKLHICEGGIDKEINDDGDVNDDSNPCTQDICVDGAPQNNNIADGTACIPGDQRVCDGNGACVECTSPTHCVNIVETECEKRACNNNKCEIAYQGTDTLASPVLQTPADCKKVVCNGNMGTTIVPDDADLPVDGNVCTMDVCTGGNPSNPPEAQNLNCGGTQVCDGAGKCVGCTSAGQCMGTDDFCKTRTCISNVCGYSYTAQGTDLTNGQTAGDCKVLECDGAGNVVTSVLQSDVPVDGNACTQDLCSLLGAPSNPPTMINSTCSVGANDACDGNGNCKKSRGKACGAGTECVTTNCIDGYCCDSTCTTTCQACNVAGSLGTCSDVPKGQDDGTCTGANQSCNVMHDCDDENGQPCTQGSSCLSGFCVDGVCCDSACGAACKACNVAGSIGTCSNVPAGSQDNNPTNICNGMNQCDGNGVCKKVVGTGCMNNGECLSGICVDGVCCATTCNTDCKSCNVAGSVGTCSNVAMGADDGGCSGNAVSCDGAGACKTENGQPCPGGGQANCFSGICADGVCCNMACNGLCQACSNAKTGATSGTCSPVATGTDPDNECAMENANTCGRTGMCDGAGACQKYPSGTECAAQTCSGSTQTNADTCNGTGMCIDNMTTNCAPYNCGAGMACKTACAGDGDCTSGNYCAAPMCVGKKANGQNCTGDNQCTNGNCVDGVCCNTACGATCQACNLTGTKGTCTNRPKYDDDDAPACNGTMTCNGMGACLKDDGEMCNNDNQCASNNCPGASPRVCVP